MLITFLTITVNSAKSGLKEISDDFSEERQLFWLKSALTIQSFQVAGFVPALAAWDPLQCLLVSQRE